MIRRRLAAAFLSCAVAASQEPAELRRFRNLGGTFQIDLPASWRQLAPNEARRIGEQPGAPADLGYVEPRHFYAVGPVDEWLAGRFDTPWLWVVEQENEWVVEDDLERDVVPKLREMWQEKGRASGATHEIGSVRREGVGADQRKGLVVSRTTHPRPGGTPLASLDVHVPAGGQQFSLSFTCPANDFGRMEPRFRQWLGTLAFARTAQGEPKVADRLWTPAITGALVALVLLVLYKHVRRRPSV